MDFFLAYPFAIGIGIQELQLHEGISAPFHHPEKSSLQALKQNALERGLGIY